MNILDGKKASKALVEQTAAEVQAMISAGKRPPCLQVIMVGDNPASKAYVGQIETMCHKLQINVKIQRYAESITENELLAEIESINADPSVDGLIVQLPLPQHINGVTITESIAPRKDIDAFHPINLGKILQAKACYFPATPYGIVKLLEYYKIETKSKHAVVLGRSQIVGLPIANMLVQKNYPGDCTVTVCHSSTKNLPEVLRSADILIVAMGKAKFVTGDMVKEGAVVIDVGINRVKNPNGDGSSIIVGDVDYDSVAPKCSFITPVPGGVGPMTIISLMQNTLQARLNADK